MTIGERLLKLRKDKNISQEELANILNVSRQTISKWETDQTSPDIDKIVPLCEYFNITSDELLSGKKDIIKEKNNNIKSRFAALLSISVGLYIISIIFIIFCSTILDNPILGVCLFFVTVAVATGLIIYNGIVNKVEKEEVVEVVKEEEKKDKISKQVCDIVGLIGVIVYLLISFLTGAWHLTWIIFLIVGLVEAIIKLLFNIKEDKDE